MIEEHLFGMQIGSIIENWVATWNIRSWRLDFDLNTLFECSTALYCTFQSFMFQAELGGEKIAESVALLSAYRTPSTSSSHWNANIELLYNYDQSHDLIINWIPWPNSLVCTPPLVSVHSAAICISICTWGLGFDYWDVRLLFSYLMLFFLKNSVSLMLVFYKALEVVKCQLAKHITTCAYYALMKCIVQRL